ILAVGLGGIALSYRSLIGIEPGLGILMILLSLKLLETNTVRDFQVLTLLGWFLCLCGLFFSQDLAMWLYLGAICLWLTASLIVFHCGSAPKARSQGLRVALVMSLQALPIVALLFLFFPRSYAGVRFQFSPSILGATGMSDRLTPGSFAALAMNDAVAFRADFPDGNVPSLPQLYWRGSVFWEGEGLSWERGPEMRPEQRAGQLGGPWIRQRIFLQPHGGRWLFALDRPATNVRGALYEAGGYLEGFRPILSAFLYDVISRPENREFSLLHEHWRAALRKPALISPRVEALVESWRRPEATDREVVDAALQYFRREKFVYSLSPGTYGQDALTEFLFERRSGFCEHYAAAFASLMRIAGIPSRLVTGYLGGTYNKVGNYVQVRQLDAHAWCEVWLPESGWLRVDPTNVIAPERISSGLESYLQSRAFAEDPGAGTSVGMIGLRDIFREVREIWDNVNYQWELQVLNFDDEAQRSFFSRFGLDGLDPPALVVWLAITILLLLGLAALWMGRAAPRRREEIVRLYERYCRRLAGAGVAREPWEGPLAFAERAANRLPQRAARIREIAGLYARTRYGPAPNDPAALAELRRRVEQWSRGQ
nr:DUF3488 and transglutaminase-like domain-containing protein [Verrucomicrobiota bacterium]